MAIPVNFKRDMNYAVRFLLWCREFGQVFFIAAKKRKGPSGLNKGSLMWRFPECVKFFKKRLLF